MGADTKLLRSRIKSVNSTLHLTRAMELVASSKIRRAGEAMEKGRQYAAALGNTVSLLASSHECEKSVYLRADNGGKCRMIVIAGDRGLAGGYNVNVFKAARDYPDAEFIPIGKRACERYGDGYPSSEYFTYKDCLELSSGLCEDFARGEFGSLGIISTSYVSMMTQEPEVSFILPVTKADKAEQNDEGAARGAEPVFEPDELSVLNISVPEYVSAVIYSRVRESFASEVAARRMAMDSAEKNASEMISELQLKYNRARQGAITQEITEIVAGSGL